MGGQFFMAKHSFGLKKRMVLAYESGEGGYAFLSKKYNVSRIMIRKWVAAYKEFGDEGLRRSRQNETYSFEFKLHVVELYLSTEVSYQELALTVGMNNPPLITKWVNDFRIAGPDALRPKRKGRRRKMDKPKEIARDVPDSLKDNNEYIKQLEDELLKLKIENAYLKELRRLRLEGTPQNKKRESSTASEDHSN